MARVFSVFLAGAALLSAALTFVAPGSSRPSAPALRGTSASGVQSTVVEEETAWSIQTVAAAAAFGLLFSLASTPQAAIAQPNPNGIYSKMRAQPVVKNEKLEAELKAERELMASQTETRAQRDARNMKALDEERKVVKLDD
eukprot:TRINITY_DN4463_c0_g1_i3.p1 TRINITY_DN4463_c0_g1~~TRINITY_DN4463_c0_g1_i3.p1  ORF type:complete len:142 (-),score=38.91 TRINITY_DN4463_c0_g1_i3:161-586(-)